MTQGNALDKVKKLRELTGVGFKDCKQAIDETKGDIEKSIEFLRKKGIAKANKKMERVAADGLISICEKENKFSIIEVNSETDFVAKNDEFIKFVEEISKLALLNSGKINDILISKMKNKKNVKDNLVSIIAKIGEKITLRRSDYFESGKFINFSYMHLPIKKNLGKIGVLLSFKTKKKKDELLVIGKHSIVGAGSIIMPGASLAEGSSIGANSLVIKPTKAWSIFAGSPAKKIKDRQKRGTLKGSGNDR